MQDVQCATDGKGFCHRHNSICTLAHENRNAALDLIVLGFSCKSNSQQSGVRWEQDPLDAKSDSRSTFDSSMQLIAKHRPKFFLLENVLGCRPTHVGFFDGHPVFFDAHALYGRMSFLIGKCFDQIHTGVVHSAHLNAVRLPSKSSKAPTGEGQGSKSATPEA